MSRDRLLGLLSPEAEEERARHALAQALYHARRTLRCDDLFVGSVDLRLNASRIGCDLWDFEQAVARGDDEQAATAYRGDFLDGFFLSGAAAFEQWAATQRDRYARLAAEAIERLANAAERSGNVRLAAARWRERVALDPLDSQAAIKLVSTLAAAGDHVGALQHARAHEALIRSELDLAPHPTLAVLVNKLKEESSADVPGTAAPVERLAAIAIAENDARPERISSPSTAPDETGDDAPVPPASQERRLVWRKTWAVAGAMVALTIAALLWRERSTTSKISAVGDPVVVAPFRVSGLDATLSFLRDGMVELLSARMAVDSGARPMDAGLALAAWRASQRVQQEGISRDSAVTVAERLGASHVIVGSAVGDRAKLILTAELLAVPSGASEADVRVEGPVDSLTTVVDRLVVGLMAARAGEAGRLAKHTTTSPAALRAFLDGQAAFRRRAWGAASRSYEAALREDSTFALAAFQLALSADLINASEQHDRALALAWAFRSELNERDAAHLIAFAGPRYPAPSPEVEQLAAWEHAVTLAPDRVEVWKELGERYFYNGSVLGMLDWRARATSALRRALSLDPADESSRALLALLASRAGDVKELERWASPAAIDSLGTLAPFLRWRVAVARDDQASLRRVRQGLPQLDEAALRSIAMSTLFDGIEPADAERAIRALRLTHSRSAGSELDALLAEHSMALNAGRPVHALDVTEQIEDQQPALHPHLRLRVLDALYGEGDTASARRAAAELDAFVRAPAVSSAGRATRLADACVLGQWRLASGMTRGVSALARELRVAELPRISVPIAANQRACAELLETWLAVEHRRPDAAGLLGRLDSLMLTGPAVSDAASYAHLVVARLYERLGDQRHALAAIRRRAYMTGWPRYLAMARREEGRLAMQLGDTAAALTVYKRYLALRTAPELALRARVDTVRTSVAAAHQVQ